MRNGTMTKKVALITGITGQDGSYLAELLLDKGYEVHGVKRRSSLFNTDRIDHLYQDPHEPNRRLILHHGDMTDSTGLLRIVKEIQPDEIYNLAAQSHVAVSFEEPEYTANADGLGALRMRESLGLEETPAERVCEVLDAHIHRTLNQMRELIPAGATPIFVALAGDTETALRSLVPGWQTSEIARIPIPASHLAETVVSTPTDELIRRHHRELTEQITFASKYINPTNRTFLVEAAIPGSDIIFRANMIAVLKIKDYTNRSTIAIPQNYIQNSRDEGQFVFVAVEENGKKVARKRTITPYVSYNGLTEIVNGLNEGDKIITAGYKDLYNGQPIDY